MSKVPVNDRSNEVIRKAAQESESGLKYDLRVSLEEIKKELTLNKKQFVELLLVNNGILKELKKMNLHLSIVSNNDIEDKDV